MGDLLKDLWGFPAHHPNLGWWIAIALASAPLWRWLKFIPIWGRRYQQSERAKKIRTLERLHNNTFLLVIYLAEDALHVAFDFIGLSLGMAWVAHSANIEPSRLILLICTNLSTSILGRGMRVQGILSGLRNYEATLTWLKAKQARSVARNSLPSPASALSDKSDAL